MLLFPHQVDLIFMEFLRIFYWTFVKYFSSNIYMRFLTSVGFVFVYSIKILNFVFCYEIEIVNLFKQIYLI